MLNRNLLYVHNIELSADQYIRIACEMDNQGNPVQYSMVCNIVNYRLDGTSDPMSITGNYSVTKDLLRWHIESISAMIWGSSSISIFLYPCLVAMSKTNIMTSSEAYNNIMSVDTAQVGSLYSIIVTGVDLDVTKSITETEFNGFKKYVDVTIGSPSAFNNFWALA